MPLETLQRISRQLDDITVRLDKVDHDLEVKIAGTRRLTWLAVALGCLGIALIVMVSVLVYGRLQDQHRWRVEGCNTTNEVRIGLKAALDTTDRVFQSLAPPNESPQTAQILANIHEQYQNAEQSLTVQDCTKIP